MSLSAISGYVAAAQISAATVQTTSPPAPQATSNPNAGPDTVTISSAGRQALASADVDHDGDNH